MGCFCKKILKNLEVISKLEITEQGGFLGVCYEKDLHFCEQTTKRDSRMSQRQKKMWWREAQLFPRTCASSGSGHRRNVDNASPTDLDGSEEHVI